MDQPLSDCSPRGHCLSHDPATPHIHFNVNLRRPCPRQCEWFSDHYSGQVWLEYLSRHVVYSDKTATLPHACPGHGALPLPACNYDLLLHSISSCSQHRAHLICHQDVRISQGGASWQSRSSPVWSLRTA